MGETSVQVNGSETDSGMNSETSNVRPKTTAPADARKGISFPRFFYKAKYLSL